MNFAINASGDASTLILNGEANIQCAADFRDVLIKLQESEGNILINLAGMTGADISFMQLLCSAHRSSVKLNKCLKVTGSIPSWLKQAAKDAGYEKEVCSIDMGGYCLWAKIRGEV
jgi:ABC-type transporter Mla MlaB component